MTIGRPPHIGGHSSRSARRFIAAIARVLLVALLVMVVAAPIIDGQVGTRHPATRTPVVHCRKGYHRGIIRVKKRVYRHHRWVVVRKHGRIVYIRRPGCVRNRVVIHPPRAVSHPNPPLSVPGVQALPPVMRPTSNPPTPVNPLLPLPPMIAFGNVPGSAHGGSTPPGPYLTLYHATVLRIIADERYAPDLVPCIETAAADGLRVHVVLAWDNRDTPSQAAAFVAGELAKYGDHAWAVSLGNEQDLDHNGYATPKQYSDGWKAIIPAVRTYAPNAILVAGEASPWSLNWLQTAFANGLPGAQAIGVHPYQCANASPVADWLSFATSEKLPIWFNEGLAGPHAWPDSVSKSAPVTLSLDQMRGAQLAGVWWDGTVLP